MECLVQEEGIGAGSRSLGVRGALFQDLESSAQKGDEATAKRCLAWLGGMALREVWVWNILGPDPEVTMQVPCLIHLNTICKLHVSRGCQSVTIE